MKKNVKPVTLLITLLGFFLSLFSYISVREIGTYAEEQASNVSRRIKNIEETMRDRKQNVWKKQNVSEPENNISAHIKENKALKIRSLKTSPDGKKTAYFQNKFVTTIEQIGDEDYMSLLVKNDEEEKTVFTGNFHLSDFEWLSDDTIAVYKNCGTECMIAYRIDLPTLQTHHFYLGSGYTWSPNRKYVFASLSVPQQVITVADAFGNTLFTLRREPLVISNTSVPHKALWSPDSSKLAILMGKESKEKLEFMIFDVEHNFSLLSRHDIDPSRVLRGGSSFPLALVP